MTWACGLCSSPRGVAQMTDKTCQCASGEGWRRQEGAGPPRSAARLSGEEGALGGHEGIPESAFGRAGMPGGQ